MQLGTRWNLGDQPPSRLPDDLVAAIRAVETAVASTAVGRAAPTAVAGAAQVALAQVAVARDASVGEGAEVGEEAVGPPWRWTLTWLEGRPVAELDDGTIVRIGKDGTVNVEEPG